MCCVGRGGHRKASLTDCWGSASFCDAGPRPRQRELRGTVLRIERECTQGTVAVIAVVVVVVESAAKTHQQFFPFLRENLPTPPSLPPFHHRLPSKPDTMQAVLVSTPGPPENAKVGTAPKPSCKDKPGTLLVKVAYTALNRADTLQRQGLYPPPPGASHILGLELSGTVVDIGPDVDPTTFQLGDRVMSLVSGGAYAECCLVDAATTMRLPPSLPLRLAAAIPEAWLTAYQLLHFVGHFQAGEKVLIHAGASSVGLAAIQLVLEQGGIPLATASTGKLPLLHKMGVKPSHAIDYTLTSPSFSDAVLAATGGEGVNLVLCCVGASYFTQNLECLAKEGRLVLYGLMGGAMVPNGVDLRVMMKKMLTVTATTLRGRSVEYKEKLVKSFWTEEREGRFVRGAREGRREGGKEGVLETNVFKTVGWDEVAEAHAMMERNENSGKIVLSVDPECT